MLNTTQNPSDQFITHIEKLVKKFKKYYPIIQFNAFDLDCLKKKLKNKWFNQFHLEGYPNFRNVALILAVLSKAEIILFLDDDEIIKDKYLTRKAIEYIGKLYKGKMIGGISGYYLDRNGSYKVSYSLFKKWWNLSWNKFKYMNQTFEKLIESKKRLNKTAVALGGVMVLHRKMFEKVPFDPWITRGEDIDLVLNARLSGFNFLFDNQLFVTHLPCREKSFFWDEMRKDIFRFYYMRKKILYLIKTKRLKGITLKSFDPYPGCFLKWSVYFKAFFRAILMSLHSLFLLRFRDLKENLKNIKIALFDGLIYSSRHKNAYLDFQKEWVQNIKILKKSTLSEV